MNHVPRVSANSECISNNCIELILFSEELYTTRTFTNIYNTQKIQVVLLGTKHTGRNTGQSM